MLCCVKFASDPGGRSFAPASSLAAAGGQPSPPSAAGALWGRVSGGTNREAPHLPCACHSPSGIPKVCLAALILQSPPEARLGIRSFRWGQLSGPAECQIKRRNCSMLQFWMLPSGVSSYCWLLLFFYRLKPFPVSKNLKPCNFMWRT